MYHCLHNVFIYICVCVFWCGGYMPVSAQYLIIYVLMYCVDSMPSSVLSQSHVIHVCDALPCVCLLYMNCTCIQYTNVHDDYVVIQ